MKFLPAHLAIILACIHIGALSSPPCPASPSSSNKVTKGFSSIKLRQTVYGLDDTGLYETQLGSRKRTLLEKIPKKFKENLFISPNGKYILYGASDSNFLGEGIDYFLYSIDLRQAAKIEGPLSKYGSGINEFIGFSPDSKSFAWQDNKSSESNTEKGAVPSLLIYSTDSLKWRQFDFPKFGNVVAPVKNCFTSQWGADGQFIYANSLDDSHECRLEAEDKHLLRYFKIDAASGATVMIEGGYTFEKNGRRFRNYYVEDGNKVEIQYTCFFSRSCGIVFGEHVRAGGNDAYTENSSETKEQLFVTVAGSAPRLLETVYSSPCDGSSIRIISWIEAGKYLLYQANGHLIIYAANSDKKTRIPQLTGVYDWLPADTTNMLFTSGSSNHSPDGPEFYLLMHL